MNDDNGASPTHRPPDDAKFEWLGFHLGVHFHPQIKLTAKDAHEFSASLSDYLEIDQVNLESDTWTLRSNRYSCQVVVTQSQLELHCEIPEEQQERYDVYYRRVLGCFEGPFQPQILLASKAMVHGLMDIEGDSRTFLAQHVLRLSPSRLDTIDRPIHALGIRLFFPSYAEEGDTVEGEGNEHNRACDWDVDVRVESWISDPRKLWVEADATWDKPRQWDEDALEEVYGRLQTVSDFVKTTLRGFLTFVDDDQEE